MSSMALTFDILARDRASRTLDHVGDSVDRTGKKFTGLHTAAVAAGVLAGAAVVKFGKDSVQAFASAQQEQAQLDLAMRKFPKTADVTRASFDKLNLAVQRKTGFDDDALASGEAVLAQFNLTGKQIQSLTPLIADYATKTGVDIPTAATNVGKALLGNTRALKALGISYKSTGNAAKDQANIQALLQAKIGGTAEAMGKTAAGKAKILGTEYENLQETVGAKLLPVLLKLVDVGLKVVDFISRNQAVIVPLVAVLGTMVAVTIAVNKAMALGMAIKTAYIALTAGQAVATEGATVAQVGLNAALLANPIGLVIVAVAGLVAGLIVAYKKSETFRNIVNGAFHAVANAWFTVVGALVNGAAKAFGWVPGIGGKLKSAAKAFNAFRDEVNASLSGIQDRQVTVSAHLIGVTPAALRSSQAVTDTGRRATGGPVFPGRTYLVGEHEPEFFQPRVPGQILNQAQMREQIASARVSQTEAITYNLTVNNPVPEPASNLTMTLSEQAFLLGRS